MFLKSAGKISPQRQVKVVFWLTSQPPRNPTTLDIFKSRLQPCIIQTAAVSLGASMRIHWFQNYICTAAVYVAKTCPKSRPARFTGFEKIGRVF